MSKQFVIACGGTGGHLFPGLAIAEVLQKRGHEVLLFVSPKEIDQTALKGYAGYRVEKLTVIGMPRIYSFKMISFTTRFFGAIGHCMGIYKEVKPSAVLSMGGFTSAPAVLAAYFKKIPTMVHDSNAIAGKANRFVSRYVTTIVLGMDECRKFFKGREIQITGTPIRQSLMNATSKDYKALGLDSDKKTIFIMGGSQGATGLNSLVLAALESLEEKFPQWQFIHLTGQDDYKRVKETYEKLGIKSFVSAFYSRMEEIYGVADVAVVRSGASSLTELAHFGLPSVLVPYPAAADDHQTANANVFVRAGAAVLLPQKSTSGSELAAQLEKIMDPEVLVKMSQNAKNLDVPDAAEKVADLLENLCRK